jgi:hypothetical protein
MASPFSEDRIKQLVVQYACRTTPVDLPTATKKAILPAMREVWPELFHGEVQDPEFGQLAQGNPGLVFALNRSVFLSGMTATVPTLLVTADTFTIAVPRRIAGQRVSGLLKNDLWLKGAEANQKARQLVLKLADMLRVDVHRTGKIAEMVFEGIDPDELGVLKERVFGSMDEKPANIQADLTFVRDVDGSEYNLLLRLLATPVNVKLPCPVLAKVDVNNRDMAKGLHPGDISRIWEVANGILPDWVMGVLGG